MFTSRSAAETQATGAQFAAKLRPGAIVALAGELGAGKTQFVKGIASALGSEDVVTSPTFTLLHEYKSGRLPIYHFDFFRLENEAAVAALGFEEQAFGEGICVVEWADRFPASIPATAVWVRFNILSDEIREIDFPVP